MSVPWTMYLKLNKTHWAFWSGGKGLSLTKPPCSYSICCSFLSPSFTFVFPSSLFFLLFSFSLFPFHSLALLRKSTAPFVPISIKCSPSWGGRYHLGRTDPLAHRRQLACITHCCGSSNNQCCSWTQQQPDSLKTNSAESSAMQRQGWWSAVLCGIRWLWQELERIYFFFFFFS